MLLMRLDQIQFSIGDTLLLKNVSLTLQKGERLGLLGRNGAGKSTLLRIIAAELECEEGSRWIAKGSRVARIDQALPKDLEQTVIDHVASGLPELNALLSQYNCLVAEESENSLDKLTNIQREIEHLDGWSMERRIKSTINQLCLDPSEKMSELSGGWLRRVSLAKALVTKPDVLLLDEPTNHLDIPSIDWLEKQIREFSGAVILITHDRRFLQRVCNRIGEIDHGQLSVWDCEYQKFLVLRQQQDSAKNRADVLFDKQLAQEELWIRKGVKARRARNEGRVRALEGMREKRARRQAKPIKGRFKIEDASTSGRRVIEAIGVDFSFEQNKIVENFSTIIQRGDRVGIIGNNGVGKSTLINLLIKEIAPDRGKIKSGSKIELAYSDQLRGTLDPRKSLIDNVCGGQQFIELNGKRRHAVAYLGDFLFSSNRVNSPIKRLSGGEVNRAILARLFTKPANLLVLDEPTNDLDIETSELLEEILLSFKGTIILASHDRYFIDRVTTSLLVMKGDGSVQEEAGGYSDWEARGGYLPEVKTRVQGASLIREAHQTPLAIPVSESKNLILKRKKLTYKEKSELEALPERLASLEKIQNKLLKDISAPDFYNQPTKTVSEKLSSLADTEQAIDLMLERLIELEG